MAERLVCDTYENAIIDMHDMTITEFNPDAVKTYDLRKVLAGWEGLPNVTLELRRTTNMQPQIQAIYRGQKV